LLVMDNRYAPGRRKWNLRIGLTSRCNIRCKYCLPAGVQENINQTSLGELTEVLRASFEVGLRRVHYTGGEPTVRRDFIDILQAAKDIGYTQQVITTNGYRLHRILDRAVNAGLTRAVVSLDTLDSQQNFFITRAEFFDDTVRSIKECVRTLPTLTKISCVTMKSTLGELPRLVAFARELNEHPSSRGQLAIKLNQFFPSNPAQLTDEGEEFWTDQFVDEEAILKELRRIGPLNPVPRQDVEGDNPSYNYFRVGDTGVLVAVLAMFSWGYPCGGCWKLRISPDGTITSCVNQTDPPSLWGMSYEEKLSTITRMVEYRESGQIDKDYPDRRHYRPQLGDLRFARAGGAPKPMVHFQTIMPRPDISSVRDRQQSGFRGDIADRRSHTS